MKAAHHTKESAYRYLWSLSLGNAELAELTKRLDSGESPDKVVESVRRKAGKLSYQKKIPVKISTR